MPTELTTELTTQMPTELTTELTSEAVEAPAQCCKMRPCGSLVAVVTAAASFHLTTSRWRLEYLLEHGRYLVLQAFFHRRQADRGIRGADYLSSRRASRHLSQDRGGFGAEKSRRELLGALGAGGCVRRIRR